MRQILMRITPSSCLKYAVVLGVATLASCGGHSEDSAGQNGVDSACRATRAPVVLSEGAQQSYEVALSLCHHGTHAVQLLLHGSTYGSSYWDFPSQPEQYSYVRAMNAHGLSTLNLDRIGVLPSDQPPVQDLTISSDAYVIHQIVQGLRAGKLGTLEFAPFDTVYLVGHSMGSAIAIEEAASHHDVNGLIITGLLSQFLGTGFERLSLNLYPANQDPKFGGDNVPDGYLTTRPGTRVSLFYHLENADPAIVEADEGLKQTHALLEGVTLFTSQRKSSIVDVPVWVLVGQYDPLFCGIVGDCSAAISSGTEALYWAATPCFAITVVPDMGHSLNLHKGAAEWFDEVTQRVKKDSLCLP